MKYIGIGIIIGILIGQFIIVPALQKKDAPKDEASKDRLSYLDETFPNTGNSRCLVGGDPNNIVSLPNYKEFYDTINAKHYFHRNYILPDLKEVDNIKKYITFLEAEKIKKQYKINQ